MWLKSLQIHLGLKVPRTMSLYEDNQSTIFLAYGQGERQRSNRIDAKYRCVQGHVRSQGVHLEYIRSQFNLAHILTKALVITVLSFRSAQLLTR